MNQERAGMIGEKLERDIAPLGKEVALAQWEAERHGTPEAFARVEDSQRRLMKRQADRADYESIQSALRRDDLDPRTRRALVRWRNRLAPHQVDDETIDQLARDESAIVEQFNGFRAQLKDRRVGDNEIDRILRESTDSSEVESAWRASKRIADYRAEDAGPTVTDRLRSLVKLRNSAAKQIGFDNAYQASLTLSELDPDWLFETLSLLERETRPAFARWKSDLDRKLAQRFGTTVPDLRPWHYGDRFFQSVPPVEEESNLDAIYADKDVVELTRRSFDAMGFDISPILDRSDLYPGDPATSRKCQHAFCTSIDAPCDVRVLCNIVPSQRWMSTNLHEFGHAVYGASLDASLPYVLRDDAHLLANEAIALLMERQMLESDWLVQIAGVEPAEAAHIESQGRRQLGIKHLVFTRWVMVMCHFEKALYENPDQDDLGQLWWQMVEEYQLVRSPEPGRSANDWASKIHFVGFPAYYQNYLLGEVFGAQLENAVRASCGPMFLNPSAGQFLVDRMFKLGATLPWKDLLEKITGKPFGLDSFLLKADYAS